MALAPYSARLMQHLVLRLDAGGEYTAMFQARGGGVDEGDLRRRRRPRSSASAA